MAISAQTVAALLGSRICHDLVSPIGAISNGVELLQMSNDSAGPEIELISESVENANARIRFFRVAFGIATDEQLLGAREIRDILDGLSRTARVSYAWQPQEDCPRPQVKIAFLMLQCLEAAMPWGGSVQIQRDGTAWTITANSSRMKIEPHLWEYLRTQTNGAAINASEVQFLLLPELAAEAGLALDLNVSDAQIVARF